MDHFLIISNGFSGSSLLHSCFNVSSQTSMQFEKQEKTISKSIQTWNNQSKQAEQQNRIYGNKIILDQILYNNWPEQYRFEERWGWQDIDLLKLIDTGFKIIWNVRNLNKYIDSFNRRMNPKISKDKLQAFWIRTFNIYKKLEQLIPDRIILNRFERLVKHPELTMQILYNFIGLDFDWELIRQAPQKVVIDSYKNKTFDINKI